MGDAFVAPGPKAGRGLKRRMGSALVPSPWRSARPQSRARIETPFFVPISAVNSVAPGPKAGRGLKPVHPILSVMSMIVAPGPKAGRGLKHYSALLPGQLAAVAPGPKAGRGLKPGVVLTSEQWNAVAPGPKAGRGLKRLKGNVSPVSLLV